MVHTFKMCICSLTHWYKNKSKIHLYSVVCCCLRNPAEGLWILNNRHVINLHLFRCYELGTTFWVGRIQFLWGVSPGSIFEYFVEFLTVYSSFNCIPHFSLLIYVRWTFIQSRAISIMVFKVWLTKHTCKYKFRI